MQEGSECVDRQGESVVNWNPILRKGTECMIDTILFDLDGTLLPMDQELFVKTYLGLLAEYLAPYEYEPAALVKTVWDGTAAMVRNNGEKTNEEVFWQVFRERFGPRADSDRALIEEFYATGFAKARISCGFEPRAAGLLALVKNKGYRLVLATNPLFPRTATMQRIRWAGLDPADFELVTTYDNSCCCKPNPEYYREILKKVGAEPERCLMVGNDGREDAAAAAKLGMRTFLVTDCLLHGAEAPEGTPGGSFGDLIALVNALPGA